MRKAILALLCACMLPLLCTCAAPGIGAPSPDENTFFISFQNQCDDSVYAIHFEYALRGETVGGGLCGRADHAPIAQDEALPKEFISEDFPEGANLSSFQLTLFLLDKDRYEYPCGAALCWEAEYGRTYKVSLTGDYKSGFAAQLAA